MSRRSRSPCGVHRRRIRPTFARLRYHPTTPADLRASAAGKRTWSRTDLPLAVRPGKSHSPVAPRHRRAYGRSAARDTRTVNRTIEPSRAKTALLAASVSSAPAISSHAGTSQDNEIATPTGLAPNEPTIILDSPAAFTLGNAPFSLGRVFERQYSVADRIDLVMGRHTMQLGFDFSHAQDSDNNDGGADPNAAVDFGSPLGS